VRSVAARAARASPDGSRVETAASPPPLLRRTMRLTADFPDEVRFAARSLDPSRLVRWAGEAADELEALLAGGEPAPGAAAVLAAGAVALRNALEILGLPEGGEGEGA